ncbi:NAD(P)H-binding protein [Polyangium sorediatum]|uniref:NAD(P)H-binding protein n=1 Tax=Polyangium sorediatum TaxID=889274 RepID=A0ABT6P4Y7_9BACT|nr:NAD(P)H-binding protein [Polyangium sorediatum]MDI1435672.1 NAD(P)H-binding protein [Polyangium sorediatum]
MASKKTVLVLGATGGIGGEVARHLRDRGFVVRALHRDAARVGAQDEGLVWRQGDAMRGEDVLRAAEGASILVHAVNPPGYRRWSELVLPMLENSLAAARAVGARLVLPGTVYNYGPNAFPVLDEDSPQDPVTQKGAIRVEMERRLRAASASGVRSLIVRAGDYFGPRAGNNWFSQGLVQPGKPVRTIQDPGRRGIGHQWSYLPDVAKTMVELIEREEALPAFARYHMAGHWDEDGTRMVHAIRRVVAAEAGGAAPKVRAFPWWALGLAAPFVPLFRELKEMRYLWQQPIRMDNQRLRVVLGSEPHTPLEEAVRATLLGLGCIDR